jgi:hypothetical protein
MRPAVALAIAVCVLAGCSKSTAVTAPVITDSFSVAGAWTGCLTEPGATCVAVTMTLADSSLSDSSATVTGTGNWGETVTIKGRLLNTSLSLNATATGVLQGWSYTGVLAGNSITGTMTIPGNSSAFPAMFTRTP